MLVAIAVGQTITSVILVPVFLQNLFGVPLQAILIPRIVGQALHIPVYAYLIKVLLNYSFIKSAVEIKAF